MKSLLEYMLNEELEDVICQDAVGNWRIRGHAGKGMNTKKLGFWKAKYKTRKNAENALKAYFAHKHECMHNYDEVSNDDIISEGVKCENGEPWVVYLDNAEDDTFTKWATKWKHYPKVGKGWYAGGAVFIIKKIDGNNVYVEESK